MDSDFDFKGKVLFAGQHMLPPAHPRCACAIEYQVHTDSEYVTYQRTYDKAIAYARASEKAGFVLGFKMAMNLMSECLG